MTPQPDPAAEPRFLTAWEREDYERQKRGEPPLGPEGGMTNQQLVARIKRSSKYWGQTAPNHWFDVRVVEDRLYHLRGNNNNYRLSDVVLGVRLAEGAVVDLGSGKITPWCTFCKKAHAGGDTCMGHYP